MTKVNQGRDRYDTPMDLDHASGLIRFINDNGEAMAYELRGIIPTYDRMKRVMEGLRDAGLVEIEHIEKPRVTFKYRLTEKGKIVASKLDEIDEIINS
jgi:DNA-binding HxlR family transcriptional regulator